MLTGCLARLLGSQFSNFTFNISIHLPKYHNTRSLSEVYNRFFRRPGFALFEDLESGFWSKMGTRFGMYRMGDYENKFRDYGTEGKPSSQPAMQHSVVFVSQNIATTSLHFNLSISLVPRRDWNFMLRFISTMYGCF